MRGDQSILSHTFPTNPGAVRADKWLTPTDLAHPHASRRRNPLNAAVFSRRGLIEQWGRGTSKMIELCREAGLPAPKFEATRHEVTVRFRPARYVAPTRAALDLTPLQREILEHLAGNPRDRPCSSHCRCIAGTLAAGGAGQPADGA